MLLSHRYGLNFGGIQPSCEGEIGAGQEAENQRGVGHTLLLTLTLARFVVEMNHRTGPKLAKPTLKRDHRQNSGAVWMYLVQPWRQCAVRRVLWTTSGQDYGEEVKQQDKEEARAKMAIGFFTGGSPSDAVCDLVDHLDWSLRFYAGQRDRFDGLAQSPWG